jgi:hypothetical protein
MKKPFCLTFPSENYNTKDKQSCCRYRDIFPFSHARKAFRSRPESTDTAGKSVTTDTAENSRPVTTDTAENSRPVTTDTAGKSLPVTTDTAGKSRQVTKRIPQQLLTQESIG